MREKNQITSNDDHSRKLPYSIVFDILSFFKDSSLESRVNEILLTTLPGIMNYENSVDLWVDLESLGEITVIYSKKLAKTILNYLNEENISGVILQVNYQEPLSPENESFVFYLENLTTADQLVIKKEKTLSYAMDESHDEKYLAWESLAGKSHFDITDVQDLIAYAWRCAELGAEKVGIRLLSHAAKEIENQQLQELYFVQAQFMRVATQHYLEAAEAQNNLSGQYNDLLKAFHLTKAWGNILSRKIPEAAYHFQEAGVSMESLPDDLYSLYRMNIFALLQFLSKNTSNAFTVEHKIEKEVDKVSSQKQQITYINSINLARLYRSVDDYSASKKYYDKAFKTTFGIKSETDFIYSNVCYGMLFEKKGDFKKALLYWIRAAIHWLVTDTKEALGWRAVRAIYKSDFMPRSKVDVSGITKAINEKLNDLAEKNKMTLNPLCNEIINFKLYQNEEDLKNAKAFFIKGVSFIGKKNHNIIETNDKGLGFLKNHLFSILETLMGFNRTDFNELIIDRTNGIDMPLNITGFTKSCYLFSIPHWRIDGHQVIMDAEKFSNIQSLLLIKKSPSIKYIKENNGQYYMAHHRYCMDKVIDEKTCSLLMSLDNESSFEVIKNKFNLSNLELVDLEKSGLISISMKQES